MDTKSLIFYRVIQGIGFMTALLRLLAPVAVIIALWLLYRIARNLEKPPKLTEEVKIVRKSLSEMLRENRARCKMTQEFVAESIHRQDHFGAAPRAHRRHERKRPDDLRLHALARQFACPTAVTQEFLHGAVSV